MPTILSGPVRHERLAGRQAPGVIVCGEQPHDERPDLAPGRLHLAQHLGSRVLDWLKEGRQAAAERCAVDLKMTEETGRQKTGGGRIGEGTCVEEER